MLRRKILLSVGVGLIACTTGRLNVDPVAISVARPSQVAMYVAVAEGDQPTTDLTASSFTLYEDGNALDSSQVKLTLLDRDRAAAHRTLVLIEAAAKSGDREKPLERGVAAIVKSARRHQPVDVYSFGGDKIKKLATLESGGSGGEDDALSELASGSADSSRDLNGAIVAGLDQLDTDLAQADKPVRIGTLIVLVQGPDLAGRISPEQLYARLSSTHHNVMAVGIGDKAGGLERIAKDGVWYASLPDKLTEALEQVATKTDNLYRSRYLLAYCSPARAGERRLRIEVSKSDAQGRPIVNGFETRFDASGFGPGCDSSQTPPFVVALVAGNSGWMPAALPEPGKREAEGEATDGGVPAEADEGEASEKSAKKAETTAPKPAKPHAAPARPKARSAPAAKAPPAPKAAPPPAPKPEKPKKPAAEEPPPGEFEP